MAEVIRPRICSVPEYVSSAGPEAIDFAKDVGLILDPWQQFFINEAFGEKADGKWSAFEVALIVSRQNGKGSCLEAMELAGLFLLGEELILHSAHEFKTAAEAFRRILVWVENTDHLRKRVARVRTSHGEEGIELRNGHRLRFVARSTGSGRGFTGHRVIMDEAYALQPAHIDALLPTMSAIKNPQLVYTSSAGMETSVQLFNIRKRGLAGAPGLAYFDYGAEDDCDPDDREVWRQTNPAMGIRISEEFVARERDAMGLDGFKRERLGIWPAMPGEEWQAFGSAEWEEAKDEASELTGRVAFAVDVSYPDRAWATIAVAGRRLDGKRHVEVIEHRRGTGWVVERLLELRDQWKPWAIVIDAGSLAGSLIPEAELAGIEVLKPTVRDFAQACGAFYDGIGGDDKAARNLRHRGQDVLTLSAGSATKRPLGDAWGWDRRNERAVMSPLVAATLADWGFSKASGNGDQPFFAAWT